MKSMKELLTNEFDDIKEINSIDGIRLTFEDGSWVLVRPSGTEDYIRVTLEGKQKKEQNLLDKAVCLLLKIICKTE